MGPVLAVDGGQGVEEMDSRRRPYEKQTEHTNTDTFKGKKGTDWTSKEKIMTQSSKRNYE